MINVKNLTKNYMSIKAINNISFNIGNGEIVGLIGRNGAGKTTTLKILSGMINPTSGSACIDGEEISIENMHLKARVGLVPETANFYECLTAREHLLFVGRMYGLNDHEIEIRIENWLSYFEIFDFADERLAIFSKGMKHKVLFASALLPSPEILVLDEPLDGLDINTQIKIKTLIFSMAAKGIIIIYSSHILDVVENVCSRLLILDHGNLIEDDSIDSLHSRFKDQSLEQIFLSSVK